MSFQAFTTCVGTSSGRGSECAEPAKWFLGLFDVCRWTDMPRGGHFAATEEPVLLATDIAAFFESANGEASHRAR